MSAPARGRPSWLPVLTADGWLIFLTAGLRMFAYGFLSVILALYLAGLGLDTFAIGAIFTAALAGGAAMTLALTAVADRVGRRRMLLLGSLLMAAAGAVFALTDQLLLLIPAAIVGTISPSGKEVGPFLSVEQAIVPQTTADAERTRTFAAYNMVGWASGALGSLLAGLPVVLHLPEVEGYRILLWTYVAIALLLLALYTRLSPAVEVPPELAPVKGRRLGLHRSRGIVLKLASLFAIDAFAGGFIVQGIIAYWFHLRFGMDAAGLGVIFFGAQLLTAISLMAAVPLARRIGLLNTMVFTHLPSNLMLFIVPFMPTLELAAAAFLARQLLSQMDVPTRQSYTMAVVDPDERSAAAGLTSVARNAAMAVAPSFAGATLAVPALGLPFFVGGGLKICYDLAIYWTFRHVRPPEEQR
jgi:MFS family permease